MKKLVSTDFHYKGSWWLY